MSESFTYYQDPGHGWIRVPLAFIEELGIAGEITSYSYRDTRYGFLEEDLDASTFIEAFKEKYGEPPKLVSKHQNGSSHIRQKARF